MRRVKLNLCHVDVPLALFVVVIVMVIVVVGCLLWARASCCKVPREGPTVGGSRDECVGGSGSVVVVAAAAAVAAAP